MTFTARVCAFSSLASALLTVVSVAETEAPGPVQMNREGAGCRVVTPVYSVLVDASGSIQSLRIGETEFLEAQTTYVYQGQTVDWPGTTCGRGQGGGQPLKLERLARVASVSNTTLRAEGDQWWVEYRFLPDAIEYTVGGQPGGIPFSGYPRVFFCWNLARHLDRACDPSNQGELGWPVKRAYAEGPLTVLDSKGAGLTGLPACTLSQEAGRGWPLMLCVPAENPESKPLRYRLQVFRKADVAHSIKLEIVSPNPDHFFFGATPVTFPVKIEALYGHEVSGKVRYAGAPFVWKTPPLTAERDCRLTVAAPAQTIPLTLQPPQPGQYTGAITVTDDTHVLAGKRIGFVWRPERIPPAPVPADFDTFWDETLAQLEAIPLELELTPQPDKETAVGRVFKARFRSWGGRWAWAWLYVPKSTNPVAARVICPPVSNYQPGLARTAGGDLSIAAAVHGGDVSESPAKADFDYMNSWIDSREDYALRYSYCNLVRCFDIVKSQPQCNGTVTVSGGSQGAGLSLVLAGLRPAAEVSGNSVALCRIDWTILGHTRWGPVCPKGADPVKIAAIVAYYDPARFAHRIRCKVRLGFGLFDWCAPAEAIFSAVNGLPKDTPVELYADPFGDHHNSDLGRLFQKSAPIEIPRWQGSDEENKVVRQGE